MSRSDLPLKNKPLDEANKGQSRQEMTKAVNSILSNYIDAKISLAGSLHPRYAALLQEMKAFLETGGKRLRPYMCTLLYQAYGGKKSEHIAFVAAAQEMLHFAMLIHDDIIDRDDVRYGVKNITGRYKEKYRDSDQAGHNALSASLLAGDLAEASAFDLLTRSGFNPSEILAASKLMYQSIFYVIGGELIDSDAALYELEETDPLLICETKTAHYTYIIPMQTGAMLAGANEDELAKLSNLGKNLGVAYQLTDDILGTFGDEAETGKTASGDIREGKRHYLYHVCSSNLRSQDKAFFDAVYGKQDITSSELQRIRSLFASSGALGQSEDLIAGLCRQAEKIIQSLAIHSSNKSKLYTLLKKSTERKF